MLLQSSQAFTALQTIDDVLVNNVLASNFRRRYAVSYGLVASITGLFLDLKVGLNFVAVNMRPSIINRFPIFPDDYLGTFGVVPGDRIILTGRETVSGTPTLFFGFRFRPI
jgi:hypothetical protein